ncbi:hypothetical protein GCM10027404_06590 [Arthrobacter tumbae]|uniref:hypothetical protein n=1 Tax=Arthrobacter tumbae TaxID=163874 RepID=UPI00195A8FE7|nr:hypothetical protein [Arthrobacter tumbae]MBM7779897.1 hypothetical protein [Arthrobacter tumbae]
MNTRSCLLTVGVSALIATGSVLTAAPASAAPGSAECLTAQTALSAQLGVASVDLSIANQLRAAITELETIGTQLEGLYPQLDAAVAAEIAAFDAADIAAIGADEALRTAKLDLAAADMDFAVATERLRLATAALEAEPEDPEAIAELDAARAGVNTAVLAQETASGDIATAQAALLEVERTGIALEAAYAAAYVSLGVEALELRAFAFSADIEALLTALGATEGTDPQQLIDLADAAVAACSAPAVAQAPIAHTPVAQAPVVRAAAPQQRGLNIQTAAHDAGATDPANLALLAGLAGFGTATAAGAVVVVRRRSAGRA